MSFNIDIEEFNGPMEMLINLVIKDELDIYNIPINYITERFIDFIESNTQKDMVLLSEFILMCSHLIEIKSKVLLPDEKLERINNMDESNDPRKELIKKILEYKKFHNLANTIHKMDISHKIIFKDEVNIPLFDFEKPDNDENQLMNYSKEFMHSVVMNLIENYKLNWEKTTIPILNVKREVINIDQATRDILIMLKNGNFMFSKIGFESVSHIIVYFLALLELMKNNEIIVNVDIIKNDIKIEGV
jgi:segregation and condensation protein A